MPGRGAGIGSLTLLRSFAPPRRTQKYACVGLSRAASSGNRFRLRAMPSSLRDEKFQNVTGSVGAYCGAPAGKTVELHRLIFPFGTEVATTLSRSAGQFLPPNQILQRLPLPDHPESPVLDQDLGRPWT